jgi:hypothetical protein
VAEFLRPLGHGVVGLEVKADAWPFVRGAVGGSYILSANAGAVLPAMSDDTDVVAADLSAMDTAVMPLFTNCRRLKFLLFPARLEEIPGSALQSCRALVSADVLSCAFLKSIGDYAFAGCYLLDHVGFPASIRRIGKWAFLASGVKCINAEGSSLVIGNSAFLGCTSLTTASFGQVKLSSYTFCGCADLVCLVAGQILACGPFTLGGSSVSAVQCECPEGVWTTLIDVADRPGSVSRVVEVGEGPRQRMVGLTSLTVLNDRFSIQGTERRLLTCVDLSALDELPLGLVLNRCFFLERVVLPAGMTSIPSRMFGHCFRLNYVNTGDCAALRQIGEDCFQHCWMLSTIDVPPLCEAVRVGHTGVQLLDLRLGCPVVVRARTCVHLKRLILPPAFRGELEVSWARSLTSLTIASVGAWTQLLCLRDLRYLGSVFRVRNCVGTLDVARVWGEVSAMGGRLSGPRLPC